MTTYTATELEIARDIGLTRLREQRDAADVLAAKEVNGHRLALVYRRDKLVALLDALLAELPNVEFPCAK
jgi:hypothetical protein